MTDGAMNVDITGTNSSGITAVTEMQAAIDSLHGKDVHCGVTVDGGGSGGQAVSDLGDVKKAQDDISRSPTRVGVNHDDVSKARDDVRGLRDDAREAQRAMGDTSRGAPVDSGDSRRAAEDMRQLSSDTNHANDSMLALESGSRPVRQLGEDANRAGSAMDDLPPRVFQMGRSMRELEGFRPFGAIEAGARESSQFMADASGVISGAAEAGTEHMDRFMSDASGATSSVSRGLVPMADAASRAGSDVAKMGDDSSKSLVRMEQDASGAYRTINAFGVTAAGGASSGVSAFSDRLSGMPPMFAAATDAGSGLGSTLGSVGKALGVVGVAGIASGVAVGVGTIAMGALAAATAAVGIGGFAEDVMHSTGAMADMHQVTRALNSGFVAMRGATADAAAPAMPGLVASVKGASHELAALGVQSEPAILQGLTSLGTSATQAMQKLAPAISPAINAATALGSAALGAFGDSAPAIKDFSDTVTAAAPGMRKTLDAMVGGLAKLGDTGAAVLGSTALKNMFQGAGDVIGAGDDFFMGLGGYPSNQVGQKNAQGQPTQMSGLDRAGLALKGTAQLGLSAIDPFTAMGDNSLAQSGQYNLREARSGQTPAPPPGTDSYHSTGAQGDMFGKETYDPAQFKPGTEPKAAMGDVAHGGLPGFSGPVAGSPPPAPMDAARAQSARGPSTMDQRGGWDYGAMTPGMGKPATPPPAQVEAHVGSSVGLPSPAIAQQLNAALQQTPAAATAAHQSLSQIGPSANQSMQQAGQAAQHVPPAIQAAMSQVAPMAAQSMAQIPPAIQAAIPPSTVAAPMHSAVQQASQDVAPAASDAGSNIGASMTSGASSGVTKTETSTITVVRKWLEKVIDEGASALDAHSPSGEFETLGESIPSGLTAGIQGGAGGSVSAVNSMMGSVIGSAQGQLGSGGGGAVGQLGSHAGTQLGQQFGQGYAGQVGSHLDGLNSAMNQHRDAMDNALGMQGHAADDIKQQQDHKAAIDQTANSHDKASDAADQHQKSMSELNAEQGKGANATDNANRHNERADALAKQRAELHDSAQFRALHGMGNDPSDPSSIAKDANAWRNPGTDAAGNMVEGSKDQITAVKNDRTAKAAANPSPASDQPAAPKSPADMLSDNQLRTQGSANGQAYGQGMSQGITSTNNQVASAASNHAQQAQDAAKRNLAISSPSQVAADIGSNFGAGVVSGINSSTSGIESVASNAGLQVGYVYAENMVTGITSILKSSDVASQAVSGIGSQLAETALGAANMLGPAGSGGEIYKNPAVTLAGSGDTTSTVTPTVNLVANVQIGTTQITDIITQVMSASMTALTDQLMTQAS